MVLCFAGGSSVCRELFQSGFRIQDRWLSDFKLQGLWNPAPDVFQYPFTEGFLKEFLLKILVMLEGRLPTGGISEPLGRRRTPRPPLARKLAPKTLKLSPKGALLVSFTSLGPQTPTSSSLNPQCLESLEEGSAAVCRHHDLGSQDFSGQGSGVESLGVSGVGFWGIQDISALEI